MGHLFRPLTLSIRLFGNMTADHRILEEFTNLTGGTVFFWVPLLFYAFGTFVCVIQAFVFSVLTMVYIRLAVSHEDHGQGHH
jgi:F-type H+-transporting ATPase subunit a